MRSATRLGILVVLTTLLVVSLSTSENPKSNISTSKPINMSNITNLINVKHSKPLT